MLFLYLASVSSFAARLFSVEYRQLVVNAQCERDLLGCFPQILPFNACVLCGKRITNEEPRIHLCSDTYCHPDCHRGSNQLDDMSEER